MHQSHHAGDSQAVGHARRVEVRICNWWHGSGRSFPSRALPAAPDELPLIDIRSL